MGFGSKLKKAFKKVTKQIKRSIGDVRDELSRFHESKLGTIMADVTGANLAINTNKAIMGEHTNSLDWSRALTPGKATVGKTMGANAEARYGAYAGKVAAAAGAIVGGIMTATGVGAPIGIPLTSLSIGAGSAVAAAGIAAGAASEGVSTQAETVRQERIAEQEEAEYAAEVERQKNAYDVASQIQSREASTVNPSAYYNIYSKYGRGGRF